MQWRHTGMLFLLLTVALQSGCVPVVYTNVPQITGRVVDASGVPKGDAVVKVTYALNPDSRFERVIPCGPDGKFIHPAETCWGVFIAGEDNFGTTFKAQASAPGVNSEPKTFGRQWSQSRLFGLGAVDVINLGDFVVPQTPRSP
jgi:hypothetical protein